MEFNDNEEKMISWLRREHSGWQKTRIIHLVFYITCIFIAFAIPSWGASQTLLMLIGACGAGNTLSRWSGRPEISLLLKLIESEKNDKKSLTHL